MFWDLTVVTVENTVNVLKVTNGKFYIYNFTTIFPNIKKTRKEILLLITSRSNYILEALFKKEYKFMN